MRSPRTIALVDTRSPARVAVLVGGVGTYVTALAIVALGSDGRIRYTADSDATIPMWHPWLPVVVGLGLAWLVPPGPGRQSDDGGSAARARVEAVALLALAVSFTVLLASFGPAEPRYLALKLTLLFVAPLVLFAMTRRRAGEPLRVPGPSHHFDSAWRPLIPAAGWMVAHLLLSTGAPDVDRSVGPATLILTVAVGFVINAVLEEFFYRKWLQTRWTRVLGGVWPAIVLSSIVWASWHVAIQGTGDLVIDLANVVANQGVTGLFLGVLWARYHAMWPLLLAHGVMNANPFAFF